MIKLQTFKLKFEDTPSFSDVLNCNKITLERITNENHKLVDVFVINSKKDYIKHFFHEYDLNSESPDSIDEKFNSTFKLADMMEMLDMICCEPDVTIYGEYFALFDIIKPLSYGDFNEIGKIVVLPNFNEKYCSTTSKLMIEIDEYGYVSLRVCALWMYYEDGWKIKSINSPECETYFKTLSSPYDLDDLMLMFKNELRGRTCLYVKRFNADYIVLNIFLKDVL